MKSLWMLAMTLVATLSLVAQTGYADLIEDIEDAIVNIRTTQTVQSSPRSHPFDLFRNPNRGPRETEAAGSGFLISADGYIVTNRHVVEDANNITVFTLSRKEYPAKLIGTDENLDVALLKIEGRNFTHLRLGDSSRLRIGDAVLAIGYPLQLGFSVTAGIVSGIGRNMRNNALDLATYIQTDADITFGNSGGPLVNPKGEVVAINTMIVTRGETYGFAIPTELFAPSIEQLKRHGEVRRGALGVTVGDLSPEAKEYFKIEKGALVTAVTRGLPAHEAGIRSDLVILAIDGKNITDANHLISQIANKAPGDRINLSLLDTRGRKFDKAVTLTDRRRLSNPNRRLSSEDRPQVTEDIPLGFTVGPLDSTFRREMDLDRRFTGVKVEAVTRGSIAERNGIQPGQIITEINHKKVTSPKDILQALEVIPDRQVFPIKVVTFTSDGFSVNRRERTVFLREK